MFGTLGGMGTTEHPFLTKFKTRCPIVIDSMVQMGQMTMQEAAIVKQMISNFGPGTQAFVNMLINRYQSIDDPTMDQQIAQSLIPNARVAARSRMGMGINPAFTPGYGGGGMGFGMRPSMFAPQINNQPVGGMQPFTSPTTPTNPNAFGSVPQPQTAPGQVDLKLKAAEEKKPIRTTWHTPKAVNEKPTMTTLCGVVDVGMGDFVDSNGDVVRRVSVYDPRIRYANDYEVIHAFKNAFNIGRRPNHRFMTVAYRQLKTIQANSEEFTKMATAVSGELLKCTGDVEMKLRLIIHTINNFKGSCINEFVRLFCEEFDAHCQCGELVDAVHPTMVMGKFESLQQILDLVTGDFDKDTLAALNGMGGFQERLQLVLGRLIDTFFAQLPKFIIHPDPIKDPSTLDDLSRVLPQIWSPDDISICGTDDLIDTFLVSKTVIEGSRTATSQQKESELQKRLAELNKNFTVLFVNRIVAWCDYSVGDVVKYDPSDGSCVPTVFAQNMPSNDPLFFINELMVEGEKSSRTMLRRSPRTIYFQYEESMTELQFGFTTDNQIIVLSTKGWK